MELLYVLLVLFFVTRFAGEIVMRFGQPALVGELLAGIALGVIAHQFEGTLPVIAAPDDDEVVTAFTDLAIFFLMLLAAWRCLRGSSLKAPAPPFGWPLAGS